jgi:hypothetical protein
MVEREASVLLASLQLVVGAPVVTAVLADQHAGGVPGLAL